jgi:hypothetical protein
VALCDYFAVCKVNISFIENRTGETIKVDAEPGKSILDVAIDLDVDIEGKIHGVFYHYVSR